MLLKAVTKTPQGKAESQEWLVIHWGYTLLIFGFCGHLGLVGFQHVVYHLHLTTPHHVGTVCYSTKMTPTRRCFKDSAFSSPCPYSALLVLPKKQEEGFDVLKILKEAMKRSYCSELRWKAKGLKTSKNLKSKGKKIKCALMQRACLALHALDGSFIRPVWSFSNNILFLFWLNFSLLISKQNYFGWNSWTFLFRNTRIGYFENFFQVLFSNKKLAGTNHFSVNNFTFEQLGNSNEKMFCWNVPNQLYPSLPFTTTQ